MKGIIGIVSGMIFVALSCNNAPQTSSKVAADDSDLRADENWSAQGVCIEENSAFEVAFVIDQGQLVFATLQKRGIRHAEFAIRMLCDGSSFTCSDGKEDGYRIKMTRGEMKATALKVMPNTPDQIIAQDLLCGV